MKFEYFDLMTAIITIQLSIVFSAPEIYILVSDSCEFA